MFKHWDDLGDTTNEEHCNKGSNIIIDEKSNKHNVLVMVTNIYKHC